MRKIKSFFITSLFTGSGKTTFTMGLLNLLKKDVISFKTGPDFIDPILHMKITGKKSYNLDSFFLDKDRLNNHFYGICKENKNENIVIEGAMGLLDGVRKNEASSDDIASKLELPVTLLIESYPSIHTIGPIINGIKNSARSNIKSIIITKSKSEKMFNLQKKSIIEETGIKNVFRFPKSDLLNIKDRHLGLNIHEDDFLKVAENASKLIQDNIDINILSHQINLNYDSEKIFNKNKLDYKNKKIAISKDEAFNFLYEDNLKYFEDKGLEILYFSPLNDKEIPDADFYYFTGGYPELFLKKLSKNKSMLRSVNKICNSEKPVIAECGGFMYLSKSINNYKMVGFFDCDSYMQNRMFKTFGYQNIKLNDFEIKGHEFHYSDMNYNEEINAFNIIMESSKNTFKSGILKNKTLGSYSHLYFKSSSKEELLWEFL